MERDFVLHNWISGKEIEEATQSKFYTELVVPRPKEYVKKEHHIDVMHVETENPIPLTLRMSIPLVWLKIPGWDAQVEDLGKDSRNKGFSYISDFYLLDDPLYVAGNVLHDQEARDEFFDVALYWMKDNTSYLAINRNNNQIMGVLVGRVISKTNCNKMLSKNRLTKSETFLHVEKLRWYLHSKVNIFNVHNVDEYFRIYLWHVRPVYQKLGIGRCLLLAALKFCTHANINVIMGLMTSVASQTLVSKYFHFKEHYSFDYCVWRKDKFGTELAFQSPGKNERSIKVMSGFVKEGLAMNKKFLNDPDDFDITLFRKRLPIDPTKELPCPPPPPPVPFHLRESSSSAECVSSSDSTQSSDY